MCVGPVRSFMSHDRGHAEKKKFRRNKASDGCPRTTATMHRTDDSLVEIKYIDSFDSLEYSLLAQAWLEH